VKKFLLALALTAAALPALAADKLTVQLDWLPGGDKAVPYVGVQRGLFAAEGLDVTIAPGRGSSDAITKVATGAADIATGGIGALMQAAAEGAIPVRAIYSVYTKQPDAMFIVKGSGPTTIAALAGKTVGTAPFSSSNALWPLILQLNGLDESKVTLLKIDPGALGPMLASGKVDATVNWITVAPGTEAVLKEAGKELDMVEWSKFGLTGYGLCLFASDRVLTQKPEVITRFLRAYAKAQLLAIADPNAAAADLHTMAPEVDATTAAAQFAASVPLIKNEISDKNGYGTFDPALLKETWAGVAKAQKYPMDKLDPEKLVDRAVLPKS
jgi:NitT/TauT family transport system substrate-binding protein